MTNTKLTSRGFTIVELLIVIVVIAILAAISIVAYNGIQNRSKASSAQSLASQTAKKAEAYNTVQSSYPTLAQLTATTSTVKEAQLDDPTKVTGAVPTSEATVQYIQCTTGARVGWFDATRSTNSITYIGLGGAQSLASSAGITSC